MMTCADFLENVGAYALGALSADERREMDAHLAEPREHAGCEAALRDALEAVAALGESLPKMAPPPSLWAGIEAQVQSTKLSALPTRTRRTAPLWVALAAGLIAILSVAESARRVSREAGLKTQVAAGKEAQTERTACVAELGRNKAQLELQEKALTLVAAEGTQIVALAPDPKNALPKMPRVRALVNAGRHEAMVMASALDVPTGHDFELWVIRGNKPYAAGLLRPTPDGKLIAIVDPKLLEGAKPDAFAVSLEPAGGSTDAPRGAVVMVGALAG